MVKSIISNLVKFKLVYLAELFLSALNKIFGNGAKFKFINEKYWCHIENDKIIIENDPNFRFNYLKYAKELTDVFFDQYAPKLGDICIEIGSAHGFDALIISSMIGDNGKLFSIEASKNSFEILKICKDQNELDNVILKNIAITDKKGKIDFNDSIENHISNSLYDDSESSDQITQINTMSMDDFILENDIKSIDYIKINIEGSEQLLIKNFQSIKIVKNIAISCHDFLADRVNDDRLRTKESVTKFLLKNNFKIYNKSTGVDYLDDWIYGHNENYSL